MSSELGMVLMLVVSCLLDWLNLHRVCGCYSWLIGGSVGRLSHARHAEGKDECEENGLVHHMLRKAPPEC